MSEELLRSAVDPVEPAASVSLQTWRFADHAWRLSQRLSPRQIDLVLRLRSARVLPPSARGRFRAMGLPDEVVESVLGEIHALADWTDAWIRAAQRFLGEARRHASVGEELDAARAQRGAALCYHAAHFVAFDDARTARALRAAVTSLFTQAMLVLMPQARRVAIPWRSASLPAYLVMPPAAGSSVPLVVLLNGVTTIKEELVAWADHFLEAGFAVLALDGPGTGEAAGLGPVSPDHDDIADGVVELATQDPRLDADRIAVAGISLGGAQAVRAVAYDRRLAAAVAITPPFEPNRWVHRASPILRHQLAAIVGDIESPAAAAAGFGLANVIGRVRAPLLVLGAGRDLVVPPTEPQRLVAAVGSLATLIWYPTAGHGLYNEVADWTEDVARWLAVVLDYVPATGESSTQVDDASATLRIPVARAEPVHQRGEG